MPQARAFAKRFPELKDVILEWGEYLPSGEESTVGTSAFPHSVRAASGGLDMILGCPNEHCRDGGFEVGFVLESMVRERLEERGGVLVCVGWERRAASRMGRTPCTAAIRYRFRLSYRERDRRTTQADENGEGEAS